MTLRAIVAMDEDRGIGKNGDLPWGRDLPADLQRFKKLTTGNPIIMGRKTFDSLPNGPLPERTNIILTRQKNLSFDDCHVVNSRVEAISLLQNEVQAMVIGGEEIYNLFLPMIDVIYKTVVHKSFGCDTFFPELSDGEWDLVHNERHEADKKNKHPYTFQKLRRLAVA